MRRAFLFVICVALGLAMILSGYLIFDYYLDRLKAESAYDELSEFAMSEEAEATEPASDLSVDDTTEATECTETNVPVFVDFEKLTAEYPDTVGWLFFRKYPLGKFFRFPDNTSRYTLIISSSSPGRLSGKTYQSK